MLRAYQLDAYIPLFAMGCAVFLYRYQLVARLEAIGVIALAAILSAAGDVLTGCGGAATALLLMFALDLKLPDRGSRALLWLGSISYSLYITHVPIGGRVVNFGLRFVDTETERLALSAVALAVCLLFAAIFYALIEKPFVRLSKREPSSSGAEPMRCRAG